MILVFGWVVTVGDYCKQGFVGISSKKASENSGFRQILTARRRNTVRPVYVMIGFLTIPSWEAQARNVYIS